MEPDTILENEYFSAALVDRPREPEILAEHERGVLLQINLPESILATILPIVTAIEPASILENAFFSTRLEIILSEPENDLRNEFFSATDETNPIVPDSALPIPLVWELAKVIEALRDLV